MLCVQTLERSVVENLEEIVIGLLLALFDTDETQSAYSQFITYVILFLPLLSVISQICLLKLLQSS